VTTLSALNNNRVKITNSPENLELIVTGAVDLHRTLCEQKGVRLTVYSKPKS